MILDANLATNRHQGVGMAVKPATHQKGGQARSAKYSPKRQKAEQMNKSGMNKSEIARKLCISRRTVINWLG